MANVLLYSSQLCLISLIAFMCYRIKTLYSLSYPDDVSQADSILKTLLENDIQINNEYDKKMDSLQQAQIFAGVQMLEIKRTYGEMSHKNMSWLREAISLYLIGAVDYLGKHARCGTATRKELITLVLKSNLKITHDMSSQYFSDALYRTLSSEKDLMVRAGAKAAKSWLSNKQVPIELSLSHQLNEWGVFA